jgi:two-component system phosphate regulon response regulator OmpR
MSESLHVLVVDDDEDIRELLDDYLTGQGFCVAAVDSAASAREQLAAEAPAVVLLDVGLPGEDGLSLARHIREHHDIGIIMVSGAGDTLDRIIGLEVGADDYLAKPFDLRELKARVRSVLRRCQRVETPAVDAIAAAAPPGGRRVSVGRHLLDLDSRQLFDADGVEVTLTRMEFDLLEVLVSRPNRPLTRDQLLNLTQNRDWDPLDRSIDIRIGRLRGKIEPDRDRPQVIRTVRGIGYMYVPWRD